jgi:hypothetical protein
MHHGGRTHLPFVGSALDAYVINGSMSQGRDGHDHALAGRFMTMFTEEPIDRQSWPTLGIARQTTLAWTEVFAHRQRRSTAGHLPTGVWSGGVGCFIVPSSQGTDHHFSHDIGGGCRHMVSPSVQRIRT